MTTHFVSAPHVTPKELRSVRRYFTPFPRWTVVVMVLAIAAIAVLVYGDATNIDEEFEALRDAGVKPSEVLPVVVGVAFVVLAAVILRITVWANRPSAEQMDAWLERDLGNLRDRALIRCGLIGIPLTSAAVLLTGPRLDARGAEFQFRVSRRGVARFTPVGVTILNFTEHQIFAYQCVLDRLTGNALFETTDEYFYRDVVSLSTRNESLTFDKRDLPRAARRVLRAQIRSGKLQIQTAEVFSLTTSGGTKIEVIISVLLDRLDRAVMGPGGRVDVDVAEQAIAGMRKMLREKKIPSEKPNSDLGGL